MKPGSKFRCGRLGEQEQDNRAGNQSIHMKSIILFGLTILVTGSVVAADSTTKDEIANAAKALGEKLNYSWKTTVVVPEDAPFKPGPTEGKTQKDGLTHISMSLFDNKVQIVIKGEKGAATNQEGAWKSLEELDKEEGPGRFMAMMVRNLKTPAKEAAELASFATGLKKDGDCYASDLTEEGARILQTWGRRGSSDGPSVSNAKGSVKFWMKDGVLAKYEFKLKGTISFNGNEFPNERTTTVEVSQLGTTKVEVPDEAKKKIT